MPLTSPPFYLDLGVQDWGQGIIGANTLQYSVRNPGSAAREVAVRLEITGPDGKPLQAAPVSVTIAPGKTVRQTATYDLAASGTHLLVLSAVEGSRLVAGQGRALPVAPLAEFQVYKSFYRDYATVRYQVNVQKQHLPLYRIEARLHPFGEDKVLAAKSADKLSAQSGEVRFLTRDLPNGQYAIEVAVLDRAGKSLLSQSLRFAQLIDTSVKDRMVTVRPSDNMLIVQGKPFFPSGSTRPRGRRCT